jgi:hypothetical protein
MLQVWSLTILAYDLLLILKVGINMRAPSGGVFRILSPKNEQRKKERTNYCLPSIIAESITTATLATLETTAQDLKSRHVLFS